MFRIRHYDPQDETQWLRCRTVAFLDSAYYDDVATEKATYANPAIELVAEHAGRIIGFLDMELETEPGTLCRGSGGLGAVVWNIGVHPDHRRRGVAGALLAKGVTLARRSGVDRLQAWARDDPWVLAWYEAQGFAKVESYLHVWVSDHGECGILSDIPGLRVVSSFCHYVGIETDKIKKLADRVHECFLLELRFD